MKNNICKAFILIILTTFHLSTTAQKTPKPPLMGLSTWNAYKANINDSIIRTLADALVSKGLSAAGYKYLNIDDGFFAGRDAQGNMLIDARKFPYGMKAVAEYIHSKGLKAGMYGDAGPNTCASIWENPPETGGIGAGFYNYEQQDMNLYFTDWAFDYLKVDYCGASQQSLKLDEETHYRRIKEAIDATGVEDYVYNVCRWTFPGTWVTTLADSWRISPDINPTYGRMVEILDLNTFLAPYMSPGHYNDMDMLEIGNGTTMTYEENKAQMSLWCVLTSPLVLGNDLNKITQQTLDIIKNEEAIAVNQDMTEQGRLISDFQNPLQIWSKKLNGKQSGERAVVLFNRTNTSAAITLRFSDIDLAETVNIRDLWTKKELGSFQNSYTANVPSHGVVMLRITGANINPNTYEAEYAYLHNFNHLKNCVVIPNQARTSFHTNASGKAIASYIGGNQDNYIEFREIYVEKDGTYPLTISYISANDRTADVFVNNIKAGTLTFNSGSNDIVATQSIFINLKSGTNSIKINNNTAFAPDIDKIIIGSKDAPLPGFIHFEAEEARLINGLTITDHTRASNGKTVIPNENSDTNTLEFNSFSFEGQEGLYPLTINYFSLQHKNLSVFVNNKEYKLNNLQSPTELAGIVTLLVKIKNTDNIIHFSNIPTGFSLDKISIDLNKSYANITSLEAETATLIKNSSDQPRIVNKAEASGGKVVGWLGNSDTYKILFNNINVKKSGPHNISVSYFSGESRNLTIKVNGTTYALTGLNSGGWNTAKSATLNNIAMNTTDNVIEIYNANGFAPDIDKILLDGSALYDAEIIYSNQITGTSQINQDKFRISHNPNNGNFSIFSPMAQTIRMLDITGKTIRRTELTAGENHISLSGIPDGIYFIHGTYQTTRLVIHASGF